METHDRSAEDVGNVLSLEHVNVRVPDQGLAALFYVSGLGFTRDPYIDFGLRNMWVNAGAQQFHLPLGEPQVLRGRIHVVVSNLDDLERRLDRVGRHLAASRFEFSRAADHLRARCPWGNEIRAWPTGSFPNMTLGIPLVEMDAAPGTAPAIADFYRQVMGAPAHHDDGVARVQMGVNQTLAFRETDTPLPAYDGHHIAIYVASFSGPHQWLKQRGLITEESDAHQYRFQAIVDPGTGAGVAELEHEVRSLAHPMYQRPLVNRNPGVGLGNYRPGNEVYTPP